MSGHRLYRFDGFAMQPIRAPSAWAAVVALADALAAADGGDLRLVRALKRGAFRLEWTRTRGFGMQPVPMRMTVTVVPVDEPAAPAAEGDKS